MKKHGAPVLTKNIFLIFALKMHLKHVSTVQISTNRS